MATAVKTPNKENELKRVKKVEISTPKPESQVTILLIGIGGGGKSTIIKQLKYIYNNDDNKNNDDEKIMDTIYMNGFGVNQIHRNLAMDTWQLCRYYASQNKINFPNPQSNLHELALEIAKLEANEIYFDANKVQRLWNTEVMQQIYDILNDKFMMDSTDYFMNKFKEIIDLEYEPTKQDFITIYQQTLGIEYDQFDMNIMDKMWYVHVIECGGQRTERNKWSKIIENESTKSNDKYDGIDILLYPVSLASYNRYLLEDEKIKCLDENFNLFQKIITQNIEFLTNTTICILLNKKDLFQEKIKSVPFTMYQSNVLINNVNDNDKVIESIIKEFENRFTESVGHHYKSKLKFQVLSAIDIDQVKQCVNPLILETVNSRIQDTP